MTAKKLEVYVAYSIHGTNAFITANRKVDSLPPKEDGPGVIVDGLTFSFGQSRTKSLRNATKLLAEDLNGKQTPETVLTYFGKLQELGWKVDDKAFRKRHNIPVSVAQPPVEAATHEPVEPGASAYLHKEDMPAPEAETGDAVESTPVEPVTEQSEPAETEEKPAVDSTVN